MVLLGLLNSLSLEAPILFALLPLLSTRGLAYKSASSPTYNEASATSTSKSIAHPNATLNSKGKSEGMRIFITIVWKSFRGQKQAFLVFIDLNNHTVLELVQLPLISIDVLIPIIRNYLLTLGFTRDVILCIHNGLQLFTSKTFLSVIQYFECVDKVQLIPYSPELKGMVTKIRQLIKSTPLVDGKLDCN
jgi:hypothetical protein